MVSHLQSKRTDEPEEEVYHVLQDDVDLTNILLVPAVERAIHYIYIINRPGYIHQDFNIVFQDFMAQLEIPARGLYVADVLVKLDVASDLSDEFVQT